MALTVPNEGEAQMLAWIAAQNLQVKLFSNDVTPSETDTAANYTEVSGGGYAAKSLTSSDWTVTPGSPSSMTSTPQTWTFTAGVGSIYGYFVVAAATGKLLWAERFTGAPFVMANNGDQIKATLNLTLE